MPRIKWTIEKCREEAEKRNWKCLSKKYTKYNSKLNWECDKGHVVWMNTSNLMSHKGCRECQVDRHRVHREDVFKIIADLGIDFLYFEEDFKNARTPFVVRCEYGHERVTNLMRLRAGLGCRKCYNIGQRIGIECCKDIAKAKNGKCLAKEYKNSSTKMKWACEVGHIWETTYNRIYNGNWCPCCSVGRTQKELSEIFQKLIGEGPMSLRPDWLKNPKTGRNLEIDIYFPKHKIAVEYNGKQHYHPIDFAGRGYAWAKANLKSIQYRDRLKRKLIKHNPDKVKDFVIFTYRNKIDEESVRKILVNRGII